MKKTVKEAEREYVAPAIEEFIFKASQSILGDRSPQLPDPEDPEPDE